MERGCFVQLSHLLYSVFKNQKTKIFRPVPPLDGRSGALMVSALVSGSRAWFWARHYFHFASLHPGVKTGTGELNAGGNPAMD